MEKFCEQLFLKWGKFLDRAERSQTCCPLNDAGDDFFPVQILLLCSTDLYLLLLYEHFGMEHLKIKRRRYCLKKLWRFFSTTPVAGSIIGII